jgi:hypothetical protein
MPDDLIHLPTGRQNGIGGEDSQDELEQDGRLLKTAREPTAGEG